MKDTNVLLRRVRVEDAAATRNIVAGIAAEGGMFLVSPEEIRTVEHQERMIASIPPENCYLVAEVEGEVVGFVDIRRGTLAKTKHTASIGIGVAPNFRGIGIGTLLLQAVDEWARQIGVRRIQFGVIATNERAIAAYQKCGYQIEGCLRKQVCEGDEFIDEYWMGKWLNE